MTGKLGRITVDFLIPRSDKAEGDRARRSIQIAGLAAMIVLKAFAFDNRGAEKDAYDLCYLIQELGIDAVVENVGLYLPHPNFAADVKDALAILRRDFTDHDGVGAGSVARFLNDESSDDLRADVTGSIGAVLRRLGV